MKILKKNLILLIAIILFASHLYAAKCVNDVINDVELAKGRNEWAIKCNYLRKQVQEFLDQERQYVIFEDFNRDIFIAPYDSSSLCIANLRRAGTCMINLQ